MTRTVSIAFPVVAAVLLVAGCGGGGEGSASTTSTSSTAATTPPHSQAERSPASADTGSGQAAAPQTAAPSPAHRGSAAGVASFETKGGDNSIQESGSEADASEVSEAAVALHGYLNARAEGEWANACSYMTAGVTAQLSQLTAGASGDKKAPGCAKLLAALSTGIPSAALREGAQADVGALRVEGDSAFLLFHGAHGVDYFMPMAQEGGEWKVAAIAPSALS